MSGNRDYVGSLPTRLAGVLCAALTLASCAMIPREPPPPLARARVTSDFSTYRLRRIGLLPFRGDALDATRAAELQQAFLFEFAHRGKYEIVRLDPSDMAEVDPQRPHERGYYQPKALIAAAERFQLDGMLVGTVTHMESYAPQALGLTVDLVSSETGLVIWSSALELDTADEVVRTSLANYAAAQRDESDEPLDAKVTLLSPSRLMRFAANEVARTL